MTSILRCSVAVLIAGLFACGGKSHAREEAGDDAGAGPSDAGAPPEPCLLDCPLAPRPGGGTYCACAPPSDPECDDDDDCVIAYSAASCCPSGCSFVAPRSVVDAEPCLYAPGNDAPESQCSPDCADVDCPAVECSDAERAVCNAGRCEEARCLPERPTYVPLLHRCVAACVEDADCVLAVVGDRCCPTCPWPISRAEVDEDPCIVVGGEEVPPSCVPSDCSDAECGDIIRCEGVTPRCFDGQCQ